MLYNSKITNLTRTKAFLDIEIELENDEPVFPQVQDDLKKMMIDMMSNVVSDITEKKYYKFNIISLDNINIVNIQDKKCYCNVTATVENNEEIVLVLREFISKFYQNSQLPDYIERLLTTEDGIDSLCDMIIVINEVYHLASNNNNVNNNTQEIVQ